MENKEDKKKGKYFTLKFILIVLIVVGLVYGFMVSSIYLKLPTKNDFSSNEYVGTWLMCGQGRCAEGDTFDGTKVRKTSFFEADKVEEILASDEGQILDGQGFYFLPEKRVLYKNGRATCECLSYHEKATWKPTEYGVSWTPWVTNTLTNKPLKMLASENINGFTPEKLGYSGDKFLVVMDNPPENVPVINEDGEEIEIPEGVEIENYIGFVVYAKK